MFLVNLLRGVATGARPRDIAIWTFVPLLICLFLMSQLAYPIWVYWIIGRVQFPWRLLVFCDFAAAVAAAAVANAVVAHRMRATGFAIVFGLVLAVDASLYVMRDNMYSITSDPIFDDLKVGAPEYLPPDFFEGLEDYVGGSEAIIYYARSRTPEYVAQALRAAHGASDVRVASRQVTALPDPAATEVLLPLLYWKHWRGSLSDGTPLVLSAGEFGLTLVSAGGAPLASEMLLILPWQPSEKLGAAISLAGLILLGALTISGRRNRHAG
jgi:hypothetical protein